ncbi:VOC family protein [Hyphomicrobiales bacterium 4NK60-0047b]
MTLDQKPKLSIDHLTVTASKLEDGVDYVRECLNVDIPVGGKHELMSTHNHLLRLGESVFLEIIAIDPNAKKPNHARWFALDDKGDEEPKLAGWVAATNNIERSLELAPKESGNSTKISRGEIFWHMSITQDGSMPFEGAYPTLIMWPDGPHPATRMEDKNCTLKSFCIAHPKANELKNYLEGQFEDERVSISEAVDLQLRAEINTPTGVKILT